MAKHTPAPEYLPSVVPCWHHHGLRKRQPLSHCSAPTLQVLECLPKAKGVLVTAGGEGSSYAFKGANGKVDLRGRVPVLKVGPHHAPGVMQLSVCMQLPRLAVQGASGSIRLVHVCRPAGRCHGHHGRR